MIGEPGDSRIALNRRDDRRVKVRGVARIGRVANTEGSAGPCALAGGIRKRLVVGVGEAELEHAEQEQEEDRNEHGELDQALTPGAAAQPRREPLGDHRTGSILIAFDWTRVTPVPPRLTKFAIGDSQVCR